MNPYYEEISRKVLIVGREPLETYLYNYSKGLDDKQKKV